MTIVMVLQSQQPNDRKRTCFMVAQMSMSLYKTHTTHRRLRDKHAFVFVGVSSMMFTFVVVSDSLLSL